MAPGEKNSAANFLGGRQLRQSGQAKNQKKKHVLGPWQEALNRYGSRANILKRLRELGFGDLPRSTIGRWMEGKGHVRGRALLALQALQRPAVTGKLDVAEPNTVLALPSLLACKPQVRPHAMRARLERERSIKVNWTQVSTGGEVLDLLAAGRADVGIAASVLVKQFQHPDCRRLATLSRAPLTGFSRENVETQRDLENRRIGAPRNASVPLLLRDLQASRGISIPDKDLVLCDDVADAIEKYRTNKIDLVIGWDNWVDDVWQGTKGPRKSRKRNELPQGLLGDLHQDIVINVRRAEPGATRAYVEFILAIIDEIHERKWSAASIEDQFGVKIAHDAYRRTIFHLSNPDIKLFLQLWEAELNRAKP